MRQIVCISTSNYFPFPTSKQHVMSRLHDAEILYFDPPVTRIAPLKDPAARPRLKAYKESTEIKPGLTNYAMPPVMPFFNKSRAVNKHNQRKLARFVKKKMKEHGFEKPILWVYSHTACDLIRHIPHSAVVYHCVDRHNAYPGMINAQLVDDMERDLCRQADLVFATAKGLVDHLKPWCKELHLMPNGVDFDRFHAALSDTAAPPPDIGHLPRPLLGFVGMLQPCINTDYIVHAAQVRPDWHFACVGEPLAGVDVSALQALPNVHLLGLKPFTKIPSYIKAFDVCLNLFRNSALSKNVSPLKFYEYLSTGKPIVSTPQPDQVMQYAELIHIADTPDAFVAACEQALKDDGKAEERIACGRAASWDSRVEDMERICTDSGVF